MRKNIVVGNWKMNLDVNQGFLLVEDVLSKLSLKENIEVVFASSFIRSISAFSAASSDF